MNNGVSPRIPKIIHHTSPGLTWEERRVIDRTAKIMPDFRLILWSDNDNYDLFAKHFPDHKDWFRNLKQGVIRADISRCLYLYSMGGVYCDTDYLFYKPLDDEFLSQRCVLGIEDENDLFIGGGYKVGNAFMASEPGFPLWRDFIETIFERSVQGVIRPGVDTVVLIGGPHALTLFIKEHKQYEEQITFLPRQTVYPEFRWMKLSTVRKRNTIGGH